MNKLSFKLPDDFIELLRIISDALTTIETEQSNLKPLLKEKSSKLRPHITRSYLTIPELYQLNISELNEYFFDFSDLDDLEESIASGLRDSYCELSNAINECCLHIPAHREHPFWANVNTISGST